MIRTEVKVYSKEESMEVVEKLKNTGYVKVADCMWVQIYHKGNKEIIVSREY